MAFVVYNLRASCNIDRSATRQGWALRFLRFLITIFLLVMIFSWLAAIGFLFLPAKGEVAGIVVFLVIILMLLFSDRLLLSYVKAKKLSRQSEINQVLQNKLHKLKLKKVDIYESFVVTSNMYFFDGFFFPPSIVLGKEVASLLNEEELEYLLEKNLLLIKSKEARYRTSLTYLFHLPFAFVKKIFLIETKLRMNSFVGILLNPIYSLWSWCAFFPSDKRVSSRIDSQIRMKLSTKDSGDQFISNLVKFNSACLIESDSLLKRVQSVQKV